MMTPEYVWTDTRRTGLIKGWTETSHTFGPPNWKQSTGLSFLFETVLPLTITIFVFLFCALAVWSFLAGAGLASNDLGQTFWSWVLLIGMVVAFLSFLGKGSESVGRLGTKGVSMIVRMVFRMVRTLFRGLNRGLNEAFATTLLGKSNSQPAVPIYQFELVRQLGGVGPRRRSLTDAMAGGEDMDAEGATVHARIIGHLDSVALNNGDIVLLEGRMRSDEGFFEVRGGSKYSTVGGRVTGSAMIRIRVPAHARKVGK